MSNRRKLSTRQEARLVVYLDEQMLQIQRGFQKRNEVSAQLPTLGTFLDQWPPVLEVVCATPLVGSTASLRDTYLLRLTSDLTEGITAYPIHKEAQRSTLLRRVLYWADVLDQLWTARVQRVPHTLSHALHDAHQRFLTHASDPARAADVASIAPPPPIQGNVDPQIPAYDQTERVRLRDVLAGAEQQLFAWMRDALGAPQPPLCDADGGTNAAAMQDEALLQNATRPLHDEQAAEAERAHEAAADEVDAGEPFINKEPDAHSTDAHAPAAPAAPALSRAPSEAPAAPHPDAPPQEAVPDRAGPAPCTAEHQHYADLFEQKVRRSLTQLDPDADEEEEEEEEAEHDHEQEDGGPRKRARREPPEEALAYWDLHFARAFARTLQQLREGIT